ncbi:unnamed protein product [Plutella xylostella]|uniref:(diamondback moth) hypothetical protein n=1 Tax=Plutella xylostella TaxID=51655 RepID=A0A8S4DD51_PLUXY|nr:unnamed protein product [Plutella xylostella]
MASSVRTRSASPKSVSFSPVLERKYSDDRLAPAPAPAPAPARPAAQPDLAPTHWRNYFNDFSAYLGRVLCHTVGRVTMLTTSTRQRRRVKEAASVHFYSENRDAAYGVTLDAT